MHICEICGKELKTLSGKIIHVRTCNGILYCKKCGKILEKGQKKYCSSRCSALSTTKGRKHSEETRRKISLGNGGDGKLIYFYEKRYCLNCKKPLKTQLKYCDNKCKPQYERNEKIRKWLKGELEGNSQGGHALFVKQYLLEKYDNKCSICGWNKVNPFTNMIPLEVEHIDGNPYNNLPENVTLLCPNCHSLTKTYKGANKGNGRRSYRKKYY
jgi:hypothetical protein